MTSLFLTPAESPQAVGREVDRPKHIPFLDGLRGLAALYVVICHAGSTLYSRFPLPNEVGFHPYPNWVVRLNQLVLAPFWRGDVAVLFFFVLSGFVIHLRFSAALAKVGAQARRFPWRSFVYRRARRLYPPLILAMLLTIGFDSIGRHLGYSIYAHQTPYASLNGITQTHYGVGVIAGNLLFLMGLAVATLGSNGALWSLGYEWWFYMLYPLIYQLNRRSVGAAALGVLGAYVVTFLPGVSVLPIPVLVLRKVLMLLPSWWMGAMMADVYCRRLRIRFAILTPLALMVPGAMLLRGFFTRHAEAQSAGLQDILFALTGNIIALGFCGILACCFWAVDRGYRLPALARLSGLGAMSYSLYVTHQPLLILLTGWVVSRSASGHLPHTVVPAIGAVTLALGVGYAAYWSVERRFNAVHPSYKLVAERGA